MFDRLLDAIATWAFRRLTRRWKKRFECAPLIHNERSSRIANSLLPDENKQLKRFLYPIRNGHLGPAVREAMGPRIFRRGKLRTIPQGLPMAFAVYDDLLGNQYLCKWEHTRRRPPNADVDEEMAKRDRLDELTGENDS